MGMYGDLLNKIDDSQFMKIVPGKPAHVRLLGHPWISQKQFADGITTRFTWPVWDYTQNRVRVLALGKSVFKQIATTSDAWPAGESMPSPFDLIIKREGTGQYDTEYTVSAVPYGGAMPVVHSVDLPDMEKVSGGIPIQQVLEGKQPPVIAANVQGAEPPRPTHTEAEALPAEAGADVLPTAEDVDKAKINLDDIPF